MLGCADVGLKRALWIGFVVVDWFERFGSLNGGCNGEVEVVDALKSH